MLKDDYPQQISSIGMALNESVAQAAAAVSFEQPQGVFE